jgi:Putative peptidoglycan binding domain
MKKFTTLMIAASLALAGAVMAQQSTPEESPAKKQAPEKKAPSELKPKPTRPPKTEAAMPKTDAAAMKEKEPAATATPAATKTDKNARSNTRKVMPETKTSTEQPAASMTPSDKKEKSTQNRKDKKSPAANANASTTPATAKATPTPAAKTTPAAATASMTPATTPASTTPPTTAASTTPAAAASASAAPSVSQNASTNVTAKNKPDVQKIQQIKQQHMSFRAQPRPDRVPAVTFSANFRLPGSERWQGPQYEVYRSYHPERHDRGWYSSHYQRVELIANGYYYFNNGYWYPAWGYDPGHEYYAYDAPIYVGQHAEPPDKVIADVQAALQEMGYYKGEVDGLIGPLTREALTAYQTDNGMTVTAVIDQPTLDSLNMG